MSEPLPTARLACDACGTAFRLRLKKGRVPTKPVPCPKCKKAITVTREDLVSPEVEFERRELNGEVRQTRMSALVRHTLSAGTKDIKKRLRPGAELLRTVIPQARIFGRKRKNPAGANTDAGEKVPPAGTSFHIGRGRADRVDIESRRPPSQPPEGGTPAADAARPASDPPVSSEKGAPIARLELDRKEGEPGKEVPRHLRQMDTIEAPQVTQEIVEREMSEVSDAEELPASPLPEDDVPTTRAPTIDDLDEDERTSDEHQEHTAPARREELAERLRAKLGNFSVPPPSSAKPGSGPDSSQDSQERRALPKLGIPRPPGAGAPDPGESQAPPAVEEALSPPTPPPLEERVDEDEAAVLTEEELTRTEELDLDELAEEMMVAEEPASSGEILMVEDVDYLPDPQKAELEELMPARRAGNLLLALAGIAVFFITASVVMLILI